MSVEQKIRVGLVGAGHICEFHVRALRRVPNVKITGVTDVDQDRANELTKRLGLPAAFPSLNALVAAGASVIHVLTPPSSHSIVTLEALELGCHAFVEKPLATSPEDCDRIAEVAGLKEKVVGVNHSLLNDPFVSKAIDLVRRGVIGEVRAFDYFRSQTQPPYAGGRLPIHCREGGYPFRDVGVHGLYLAEVFLGEIEDTHTRYDCADGTTPYFFGEWRTTLRCRKGMGQLHLSWSVRPQQSVFIVQGTHGILRADLFGMVVTTKRNRRMPEFVRRIVNTWTEGFQTCLQVQGSTLRVLLKRIRKYHGVQESIIAFYKELIAGRPAPVTPLKAKRIVFWMEQTARKADQSLDMLRFPSSAPMTGKVLVTGATGFVGGQLIRRLLTQHSTIRILSRRPPPPGIASCAQIETVLGDLGDPEAVDRAVDGTELIYHVGAAMRGVADDFLRGTIHGTQNVVDSAIRHKSRLVYVSSLSVLQSSNMTPNITVREDWPLEPHPDQRGWYSRAKLQAERIVSEAVDRGLQATILRPGQVIGSDASFLTPAIGMRRKRVIIVFGNGERTVPIIHVDDLIDAMLLAAKSKTSSGTIFHLVDPTRITQNDLIRRSQTSADPAGRARHVPWWVVLGIARIVGWLALFLRRGPKAIVYRLKSSAPSGSFNCEFAASELGWKPTTRVAAEIFHAPVPGSSK